MPSDYFPDTSELVKKLGGYDIYKSGKHWMALLACKDNHGRLYIKWYRWELRSGLWKVALCNMKVHYLNFNDLQEKIDNLKEIYEIR